MGASTPVKRATLRYLYRQAVAAGASLLDHLNAQLDARMVAIASGTMIVQAAGNGQSVTLEKLTGLSPVEIVELLESLITLYESVEAYLTSPTDASIRAEMLLLLGTPCNEVYADWSQLRTGPDVEAAA